MKYYENMKEIRQYKNISAYKIEKEIQISHQQIYNWESGKVEPSITQFIKLADYYGVSLDELAGREYGHYNANAVQINNGNNNTQNNYFRK